MSIVQLKGNFRLGPESATPTDYSHSVSSFTYHKERVSITVPPDLLYARESEVAGPVKESITINFHSSTAAASLWAELLDAINTDSAELEFSATLNPGAAGPDNPTFSGKIVVLSLDTGATVGALREQSQTYPVTVEGVLVSYS